MTSSSITTVVAASNTDELPRPDVTSAENASGIAGLKRPTRTVQNVTDTGRISFGAAMRLPLSK